MAKTNNATSNLGTMKDAIIEARKQGNRRAISKADLEKVNVTEQSLANWEAYVEELRLAAMEYVDLTEKQTASDDEIQVALGAVYAIWRRLLKEGTEKEFDARFFIRKSDIGRIAHLCGERIHRSTKFNAQLVHAEKADFRKNIETIIGIRMAGNGVLNDDDRDTMVKYEQAQNTIKAKSEALDGFKKGKETILGLKAKKTAADAALVKANEFVETYKLTGEAKDAYLKGFQNAVDTLKADIDDAEAKLKEAKKTEKELKKAYTALGKKLNMVGAEL